MLSEAVFARNATGRIEALKARFLNADSDMCIERAVLATRASARSAPSEATSRDIDSQRPAARGMGRDEFLAEARRRPDQIARVIRSMMVE